jgi:2-haloalkanoic acid dehalogenase type II
MLKFSHLTFDCYGTLIDWRNGIELNLGGLLKQKGLTPEVKVFPVYLKFEAEEEEKYKPYREVLRDTAIKVANSLNVPISENGASRFAESVPSWPPFADTVEIMKELGRRGYKRVILSNIDRDILRDTILQNDLAVDGYITADDIGSYKPSEGHWKKFFDMYGAGKDCTLHVASSIYHDIIPASKLGITNAWINRYSEPKSTGVNPTYVFQDLKGLLDILP